VNRKVKYFKQSVSIETARDVKNYNKCSKSSLSALTQVHNCFLTRILPCR